MDKLEVHRRGLRHPAVSVFVLDDGKVLIQRRAAGKYHSAGLWANTVCTHPHWNEPPDRAARRRLREELGITGVYPAFVRRVEYRADVGHGLTEHERVDVYLAFAHPGMTVTPDPAEVSETRWVGLYDLVAEVHRHPGRFAPWLRIYLTRHLDAIFGTMP
ncbi:isopentenyl-diphosphate Delta-isomerase [Paenirhodobacter sp.]|uniref:isopentenyl-diphosphate Delta-isomerase n=1 Tax=Paenirhodobacter sp. TaxID=1965326 RepID=UPI003B42052D